MEVCISRQEILNLQQALSWISQQGELECESVSSRNKFLYAIAKNKRTLADEAKAVTEGLTKYHEDRIQLCEMHAKKDKKGKPVQENGSYVIKNQEEFRLAMQDLQKQHEVAEYMSSEVTVDVYAVSVEHVAALPPNVFDALMPILSE